MRFDTSILLAWFAGVGLGCGCGGDDDVDAAENTPAACADGADNDSDGHVDCDDQDCDVFAVCVDPDGDADADSDADSDTDADVDADSDADADADADADGDSDADGDADADTDCELDPDADDDGIDAVKCGGDDCDDLSPRTYPGAPDNDGVNVWTIETAQGPGGGGHDITSLAISAGGEARIVTQRFPDDVRYLERDGAFWSRETLSDDTANWYPSLALDATDAAHVSFHDVSNDVIRHGTNASGDWDFEDVVDADPYVSSRIAVAPDETLRIAFATYGEIHVASNASGAWESEGVDAADGGAALPALAIDDAGTVHIAYTRTDTDELWYARGENGGGWDLERVDGGDMNQPTIAVADDGVVHIAYEAHVAFMGDLRYASNGGGAFEAETLDIMDAGLNGEMPGMAVDSAGAVHIAYEDDAAQDLRYVTNASGEWVYDTLDEGESGRSGLYPSVVWEPNGTLSIAYIGNANYDVYYARRPVPDGVDQNCDGVDGEDFDGDGFAVPTTGGNDCDDLNDDVYPGAQDDLGDGIDRDCDGIDG